MKKIVLFVITLLFLQATAAYSAAGFTGWRKISEISSTGPDGGFVIVLNGNMDNSFCSELNRGFVDPSFPSHKTILALATSAFMAGKEVQLYTQSCITIWGTQYTVFDRIQIK